MAVPIKDIGSGIINYVTDDEAVEVAPTFVRYNRRSGSFRGVGAFSGQGQESSLKVWCEGHWVSS